LAFWELRNTVVVCETFYWHFYTSPILPRKMQSMKKPKTDIINNQGDEQQR